MTAARNAPAQRHLAFPPRWHTVLVPTTPTRSLAAGMTMYAPSKPKAVALQHALWAWTLVGRGRLVPGAQRAETWQPPVDPLTWRALRGQWADLAGHPVRGVAVYRRANPSRANGTFLVCTDRSSLLIRMSADVVALEREQLISRAAEQLRPSTFCVPRLLGTGDINGAHWAGYETMSRRPHLPAYRIRAALGSEIEELVESTVARQPQTPSHWRAAHRDLTPWNLRVTGRTRWLIDWEDAGFAPPHADAVFFAATRAALRGGRPTTLHVADDHVEATTYWREIVQARHTIAAEDDMHRRLLIALGASAATS